MLVIINLIKTIFFNFKCCYEDRRVHIKTIYKIIVSLYIVCVTISGCTSVEQDKAGVLIEKDMF
jgi:hypothetical protein